MKDKLHYAYFKTDTEFSEWQENEEHKIVQVHPFVGAIEANDNKGEITLKTANVIFVLYYNIRSEGKKE